MPATRAGELVYRLQLDASEVRVRYPEGVSTVANASLKLTGTSEGSLLAGTITILRTGFNPRTDFSFRAGEIERARADALRPKPASWAA